VCRLSPVSSRFDQTDQVQSRRVAFGSAKVVIPSRNGERLLGARINRMWQLLGCHILLPSLLGCSQLLTYSCVAYLVIVTVSDVNIVSKTIFRQALGH